MSLESVKEFLAQNAPDLKVREMEGSLATVPLAARALMVSDGQIAKTLTLKVGCDIIILVARGDSRLDNRKIKEHFGVKARMLDAAEVERITGHPVGGVCPFGLSQPLPGRNYQILGLSKHVHLWPLKQKNSTNNI
ncbi:MAG: YbaK/EbsC family protein [Deltaproteobacteria bacterium]|jgi:prolyl-tRNA editing enzyme YbaK/EbsC (Cys-tRNA(Pro) deacylase)|nr:YbaK/EbsC family protein [Deltaproteobacteria bacterium]